MPSHNNSFNKKSNKTKIIQILNKLIKIYDQRICIIALNFFISFSLNIVNIYVIVFISGRESLYFIVTILTTKTIIILIILEKVSFILSL